ncbi:MAG: T9SS type A sorting domain-containing protein, partial [Bacteroidota bacterium]
YNFRVGKTACFFKSIFCDECESISTDAPIAPNCSTLTSVVENSANENILVFPNPFQDKIEIAGLKGDELFILNDISGRTLYQGYRLEALNSITFHSGVYVLGIIGASGQQVVKLLKE